MKIKSWKRQSLSKSLIISLAITVFSQIVTPSIVSAQEDSLEKLDELTSQNNKNGANPQKAHHSLQNVPTELATLTNDNKQTNPWLFLHPYQAEYSVISDGDEFGYATRTLSKNDPQWSLTTSAKISRYLINVKSDESTKFHLDNQRLITEQFDSKTKITFKKARIMEQRFDWENGKEYGSRKGKTWELYLDKLVFDRVSHIVQLRSDLLANKKNFSYDVSYKGKFRKYDYIVEKEENIETKMGILSAIKLTRNKSNDDKFSIWLSPELNYFPVKIAQYEKDEPDITLLLKSLQYQQSTKN